jgi:hypothetical protein
MVLETLRICIVTLLRKAEDLVEAHVKARQMEDESLKWMGV